MKTMRIPLAGLLRRPAARASALLDQVMPQYEVASRHSVIVRAPAAQVYAALTAVPFGQAPVTRVLFGLRRLPATLLGRRVRPVVGAPAAGLAATARRAGFVVLAEHPGREILLGIAGSFWRLAGNVARIDSVDAWCTYQQPGTARATMAVRVEPIDYQTARLSTETRVQALGRRARVLFRLYWTLIAPFSGLLRRVMLRQVKTAAERQTGLFLLTP
ncbi:MAG TPA: hypothetical protein VKY74_22670 [Chloroflexia bacterium]|nr:hypothetical protein [Chloroflexia bacterium]